MGMHVHRDSLNLVSFKAFSSTMNENWAIIFDIKSLQIQYGQKKEAERLIIQ